VGSYWREACNIKNKTETMAMDGSYCEEGGESIAKQALDGIHREPDGEEDQSKPGKGLFRRKQENDAKYGAQLRRWQTPETDGDASQMPCVSNGIKEYTTAVAAAAT
jgi:hypothetical protein